ncbi:MAG: DNA polymerase domain-containing protein, partial [Promethearchaeota archaeon]
KRGKTGLYEGMLLARIANLPLKRVMGSRRVSEWIRTMLHTAYRNLGILIPDSEELKRGYKPHRVEGALTIAPTSGAYYNMAVLDFESLYPSCIDYYNLSYETIDCGHDECKSSRVPGSEHYVCQQKRGIFSALIGALKDLRIHWYKQQVRQADINPEDRNSAKVISDLLKLFLVSCFGCTIRIPGLACPPLAESVTAYGRWALQTSWDLAKEYGMYPVYGDTDSLFLDNPARQQIERLIGKIMDDLGLILSIDVTYPLCVLSSAKKAYFGMLADGTPDIKGITLGKSSTPPLFRDIFLEVVSPLGGVDAPEKLAERIPKVLEILNKRIRDLRKGTFSIKDMEYRVIAWKAMEGRERRSLAQPYQAIQQLSDRGISVKQRKEVTFVKVKPFRYAKRTFTVKPTQFATKDEIDIPDYLRKLELAFQQVLEPLGIKFPAGSKMGLDAYVAPSSKGLDEDQEQVRKPEEPELEKRREPQRRLDDFE